MTRFNPTERIGVTKVEELFLQFNWIPRIVFQSDVGIDMFVEICTNGNPIGKFIGVQIKSGKSYFEEKSGDSIIFRSDKIHIDYWINNSLPILIVLHNIEENLTIWQVVNKQTVEPTGKNFKIRVPLSNTLERKFVQTIESLTGNSPILNNFQKLLLARPIIDLLVKNEKIVVDLGLWVNKSSGKADVKIYHIVSETNDETDEEDEIFFDDDNKDKQEILLEEYTAFGVHSYQSLHYFYKWADFILDEEFYEEFSDYDEDEMPGYKTVFIEEKFHDYKLPNIPYHNCGEVASYRFIMQLNDYGRLIVDFFDCLENKKQLSLKFD